MSSRCDLAKTNSWPWSARDFSLCFSCCYIPAWWRMIFRWGIVMSSSLKGAMPCSVLFASNRSRPTVQSTHHTNKKGPAFWSIHLRTRIIVSSPQILSVRPRTKAIFKTSFFFKYVLLRSQICIPRALKKRSSSSFLQRTTSAFLIVSRGTHSVWPLGRVATLGYEDNGGACLF
jgi:hypothetical protein